MDVKWKCGCPPAALHAIGPEQYADPSGRFERTTAGAASTHTPDGPATAIAIRMIAATNKENYRGTIFLNQGGPGGSGTNLLGCMGKNIGDVVGPSFDLLGFDHRGTGMTTPLAWCCDTESERAICNTQEGHQLLNASDDSVRVYHARAKLLGQRCEKKLGGEWGIGRFVSTPYVSRDMLEISQMLRQDKLQFWGFGSVLGQYFTAIYPDKAKRLVVDGVYDAENYKAALWNTNIVDVDRVVDALFDFCHQAGPHKCALYESSPDRIQQRFFRVLERHKLYPVPVPHAETPVIITRIALLARFFYSTDAAAASLHSRGAGYWPGTDNIGPCTPAGPCGNAPPYCQ
ncbi:hypothetical protein L226DRAFT_569019 [Lentinus tigrinus ALCF2SS1-7]|uniref:Uncharacterized protein n=1 Tax=Lentinus tigrinus ALCF2SS1-6 TaxID=1328759 RepID=A0A5C2RVL9_9APHY|nr:hypothetical protein L227DRAFT_657404 [Lentinus tigrinus ALCF2SS1-6]RPD76760.1 hypothetical protein L226DRAFT_569019 [Lentinus tigrinus ALCF2SS1-7]